jgi:hypothetical protein
MGPEEISRTCVVEGRRYTVHLHPTVRRVAIYELPEFLPNTAEGLRRMSTPVAAGTIVEGAIVWQENSMGPAADVAASWTVAHMDESDRLLFFVDETGGETLEDPNYPVFGLGGCVVRTQDYRALVAGPWRQMKFLHFGGLDVPLHAAGLAPSKTSREQMEGIAEFFKTGRFYRVAAVVKKSTRVGTGIDSMYQAAGMMLLRHLAAILNRAACTGVTTVLESSERGDRLAQAFFPAVRAHTATAELPLRWGTMTKAMGEPGLEVADFIMQAAGNGVHRRKQGQRVKRKDFACIFQDVDAALVQFGELESLALQHNPEGTIDGILIDPSSEIVVAKRG